MRTSHAPAPSCARNSASSHAARPPRAAAGARALLPAALLALAILPTAFLAGCDNPACVFGGTCSESGQGGALGTLSAFPPEDGQVLRAAAPTVQRFAPTGEEVDPKTPIVLVFSEAMAPSTLSFAYQLEQVGFGVAPLQATALVGDGRVLVLYPLTDLVPGSLYRVSYRQNATVGDRTGQAVVRPSNGVVGEFTVALTTPEAPSVVLSYPDDLETGLPATTEIVVVFSRPVDPTTVDGTSFVVEVGGAPPPFDDEPEAIAIAGVQDDFRGFVWKSVDLDGNDAAIVVGGDVSVELSPDAAPILDPDGNELAPTTFTFETLPFSAPLAARITSFPSDAIGISNLSGAADLAVEVEFDDALAGDSVGVFVFGTQPEDVEAPLTIALFRTAVLTDPPTTFTFTAAELDLLRSESPLQGRVRDGTIQMAFRVQRGALESPVRMLDVDLATSGAQGPVLDTVAPVLLGVGNDGASVGEIVSTARDVVVSGRASEALRAAFVTTALGDNEAVPGEPPPVVGSDGATGLFVAAPVRLGLVADLDEPLGYQLTIYDRALNPGGTAAGTYVQRGAAAAGTPRPFANVAVEVYDAATLLPIAGADVLTHEEVGGSVFEVGAGTTDADGRAVLDPALIGRTLVTVRRAGYDLFTFDGVPTDVVSIPLTPTLQAPGSIAGQIASTDLAIGTSTRRVADTRFPRPGETLGNVGSCALDSTDQRYECNYGPFPVNARELGALTGMSTVPPSSALAWAAPTFLRGFGLRLPMPALTPGTAQTGVVVVLERFDVVGIDEERIPVDVLPHVLTTGAWPTLDGAPRIRVEGLVPGLPAPLTVGQGVAFSAGLPPSTFAVRAAYPGAADPIEDDVTDALGELVADGVLEPELYLRAEVVGTDGARGIDRPRLSTADSTLEAPEAPVFVGSALVENVTGVSYDVFFSDVLPDAQGQPGLHRLVLTDAAGRRWHVWRLDAPDAEGPAVVMHLPLAVAGETFPLAPGDLTAVASSWSWTAFDPTAFLWSDVEREFERAAHSAPTDLAGP